MVFDLFKRGSDSLDLIEAQVQAMLDRNVTTFGLAADALFGRVAASDVMQSIRKSDRKVNRGEREIRRELIVHAGVAGPVDFPLMLVYMSIIKDIERVGDYAKNVWDLANDGFTLAGADDSADWQGRIERTKTLIGQAATIFHDRDIDEATRLLPEVDSWLSDFDAEVSAWVQSEAGASHAVPRALLNRYLKRITAHLMNVMTAVVMPFDRLDYWDEDKIDRES
jgi:phosphate transport system protein